MLDIYRRAVSYFGATKQKLKAIEEMDEQNLEGQLTLFPDNADYDAFTEKFKPKRTTDDCYTPQNVYDAVASWVAAEYGRNPERFVRPFWPGGDYEHEEYPDGCTIVDNPPFSIMKAVCNFYNARSVPFFLFCPALTPPNVDGVTIVATGCDVCYENGATISTSFVTNLQPELVLRTAPALNEAVDRENKKNLALIHKTVPRYEYPDHVITAALAQRFGQYGVEFSVHRSDAVKIRTMDAQRAAGKIIFGYGWLLSDRAAAERAAADRAAAERAARKSATVWKLSDREKAIVQELGKTKEVIK